MSDPMFSPINQPEVVSELTELYHRYEKALCSNDIPTMSELFWDSADVVRLGATENLYGSEEIEAFRRSRPAFSLEREMLKLKVVTFGSDTGSVTLEFRRIIDGIPRFGRQSQVWRKFPDGWKIVSAHVSFLPVANSSAP